MITFSQSQTVSTFDASKVRAYLGLGTAATQNTTAFLQPSSNLSDVSNAATARANLGLSTTANQTSSTDKNFVTDAQLAVIGNTSGTNTGDNAANSTYANDYRSANFVAGTNYLAPNGNGSALTGLTESQIANLSNDLSGKQASNSNLTTIAGLTATTDNFLVSVASAWASRTPAQVKTTLALDNLNNTSDANKPISTATQTALDLKANLASPTFTGTVGGVTAAMVGLGNVTNESKATMFTNATFTGTFTAPNTTITNAMLAGSIDAATKLTGVLPFANGGLSGTAATSATTGTMTVNMTSEIITITPTGACTFNASGGIAGQRVTFLITTSGTTSFTLTWGTNFKTTATLATGTTTAKKFCVSFVYDGSTWTEFSRTAAM